MMTRILLAAALLVAVAPHSLAAQERQHEEKAFEWSGRLPDGSWLRLKNMNGEVRVVAGTSDRVEVVADKSWRRGDPRDVRFDVQRDGDNVTICALWFENASCSATSYRSNSSGRGNRRNDVNVTFTVRLPRGVRIDVATVNGQVNIRDAGAEVVARTVNGGIDVATSNGPVSAKTVNGGIDVRMGQLDERSAMEFETVNGSISIELPAAFNGEIDMSTVNGGLRSDFPLQLSGRISPRHLRATIGNGGREVRLRTVNGGIELLRGR